MRRKWIVGLVAALICSGAVYAQFKDNSAEALTVEQLNKLANNDLFVAEGFITGRVGDEKYFFKDDTGTIKMVIPKSAWQGFEVTPKIKVRLNGRVKRPLGVFKRTFNVDRVSRSNG